MKTLYIECRMGCAGDMLMGALSELTDQQAYLAKMNSLGIDGLEIKAEKSTKCGIAGTHMRVKIHGEEEGQDHVNWAVFSYQLKNLQSGDLILEELKKIEGMKDINLNGEILQFAYDHDHENEAENALHALLAKYSPETECIPLGHIHHHDHDHHEIHVHDINHLIDTLNLEDEVKEDAKAVYALIAEAEAKAHGMPVDQIHFHEVGTMDALADVVGCCVLFHMIDANRIYVSPVATGSGMVKCAHGIVPVPAPATAYLLEGIPAYSGRFEGELCTPTGAALLKYFADSFDTVPPMVTEQVGYGMGTKDFPAANCVRAFLGETKNDDETIELTCNLDDETGEEIGHAVEVLMKNGALDVYTVPVQMKKNRPGLLFTCMCRMADKEKMLKLMFTHLTTLGVRESTCIRHTMSRHVEVVDTAWGKVRVKYAEGYGISRYKYEYEDLAAIADKEGCSIDQVRKKIEKGIR